MSEDKGYYAIGVAPVIIIGVCLFVCGLLFAFAFKDGSKIDISQIGHCSACPQAPSCNPTLNCSDTPINYSALCKTPVVLVAFNGTNYTISYLNSTIPKAYYVEINEGIRMGVNSV